MPVRRIFFIVMLMRTRGFQSHMIQSRNFNLKRSKRHVNLIVSLFCGMHRNLVNRKDPGNFRKTRGHSFEDITMT